MIWFPLACEHIFSSIRQIPHRLYGMTMTKILKDRFLCFVPKDSIPVSFIALGLFPRWLTWLTPKGFLAITNSKVAPNLMHDRLVMD